MDRAPESEADLFGASLSESVSSLSLASGVHLLTSNAIFFSTCLMVIDLQALARCRRRVEKRPRVEVLFHVQDDQHILLSPDNTFTELRSG